MVTPILSVHPDRVHRGLRLRKKSPPGEGWVERENYLGKLTLWAVMETMGSWKVASWKPRPLIL